MEDTKVDGAVNLYVPCYKPDPIFFGFQAMHINECTQNAAEEDEEGKAKKL